MISQEVNPAAKRLKLYDEEQSIICSQTNQENYLSNKHDPPVIVNEQTVMESTPAENNRSDTQDILAKACSVIGLESSMIELAETPHRVCPVDNVKERYHYPLTGRVDKNSEGYFQNGYRNYPQPYYSNPKTYLQGCHTYSTNNKEQAYSWNKHQPRKYYITSPPDKIHHHFPYPKNQYAWHPLNNSQSQTHPDRTQYHTNRPCLPIQQQCRVNYNNGVNGVSQNGIHPNYVNSEVKRYMPQYVNSCQRQNSEHVTSSMSSCRFSQPNYTHSNHTYPIQNNFEPEVNITSNKSYYDYGNGYSQQTNNEVPMTKKIPGFESFCKIDPTKNVNLTQYSPISSPISPTPRQVPQSLYDKYEHLHTQRNDRFVHIPNSNKPINNSQKSESRKFFPNDFYQTPSYKDNYSNDSHVRQGIRQQTHTNGYSWNGNDMNSHNFSSNQNAQQLYSPNNNPLLLSPQDTACSYNVYDYNSAQSQKVAENVRQKELNPFNGYNTCKETNNLSYDNSLEPKLTAIDYSLYGTDEIIKNSVKTSKTNLPHSPNIELIPLEGTSIISNLSDVSNKSLPEISINSIKAVSTNENFSSHQKDSFSCSKIHNVNNIGLQNSNDMASCDMTNNRVCVDSQHQNKESSIWHEKELPQYTGIPELTSITEAQTIPLEYSQLDNKNVIQVQNSPVVDIISKNDFILAQPLQIDKILNKNFVGTHSKHRPASEPLFQQRWSNLDEAKRPLSVPVNGFDVYSDSSLKLHPEDEIKITNFQQKLKPILEHLLSIPEATPLLSLKGNPKELLKHLVKLWGGVTALSSSKIPLINIKENFLMLVKLLFKATLLLEWGWQNATADRILDDLVTPTEGDPMDYRVSLEVMSFACPPTPYSDSGLVHEDEFSSISEHDCTTFIYQ